jgi:ribonuclease HI
MKNDTTYLYTDGSDKNYAVVVVESDTEVARYVGSVAGEKATINNDQTESAAAMWAAKYAAKRPGHYVMVTDSKSLVNKINSAWKDHTRNADFAGVRRLIHDINADLGPFSFRIMWKKRLSDKWMKLVDELASKS